ncbi:MAG: hypothetical protein AVDCRST_MAG88-1581, partial [uncultured Thermomicrobiales bacterium]
RCHGVWGQRVAIRRRDDSPHHRAKRAGHGWGGNAPKRHPRGATRDGAACAAGGGAL